MELEREMSEIDERLEIEMEEVREIDADGANNLCRDWGWEEAVGSCRNGGGEEGGEKLVAEGGCVTGQQDRVFEGLDSGEFEGKKVVAGGKKKKRRCLRGYPSAVVITSSCSTDETIVADSDVEVDMAASNCVAEAVQSEVIIKPEGGEEISEDKDNKSKVKGEIPGGHADAEQKSCLFQASIMRIEQFTLSQIIEWSILSASERDKLGLGIASTIHTRNLTMGVKCEEVTSM
ncbi:hypothetical protein NE237_005622 [Protea cynaroides]|uniref:Uncharacterized protein n=1 Tax=Protea cynaroides TaxID=273540 RepID=A0A9Q0QUJ7_9MAGN|nr:hypothetical protein NE237_005622 [Protea cynaroides]